MSRWMIFWACTYRRAHPSSAIQNLTASSVNVFLEMWNRKSPPVIKSTTRYLLLSVSHYCVARRIEAGQGVHVFNVLETVSQVADERVVDVFEHSALTDDVTDALGSYDCGNSIAISSAQRQ